MITRVQVKNYRSLRDVDVTLGPLNVFVGKNGAGKSAFLDVLAFVRDALTLGVGQALSNHGSFERILHLTPQASSSEFLLDFDVTGPSELGYKGRYAVSMAISDANAVSVRSEYAEAHSPDDATISESLSVSAGQCQGDSVSGEFTLLTDGTDLLMPTIYGRYSVRMQQLITELKLIHVYKLEVTDEIRRPQLAKSILSLDDDGTNLTSVLAELCRHEGTKIELTLALKRLGGDIRDVRVVSIGSFLGIELQHSTSSGSIWRPIELESQGTLRFIFLLTTLLAWGDDTIAIEEPELYLYPDSLPVIADFIREASLRRQVIITTQSPDLISHFSADELRIVENVDGETRIGPIEDRQREAINAELFSGGDLLRIEGLFAGMGSNA